MTDPSNPVITSFNTLAPIIIQEYENYLPNAFDNSLTLLQKVNKIIQSLSTTNDSVNNLINQWNDQIVPYVNGDGFQTDVNNKLDAMASDGTLASLISTDILGNLSNLKTTYKTNIVGAVNENFDHLTKIDTQLAIEINVKYPPTPLVGAKGDGTTDDTSAIQGVMNYLSNLYGGDTSSNSGYIGWYEPKLIFPYGTYICDVVTSPSRFKMEGIGQAVIQSKLGTSANPFGNFVNNTVTGMDIKNITFLYYDTVFITPTGNVDFTFITFDNCKWAHVNCFIDMVSYTDSRSTTFRMYRCHSSYAVKTVAKLYCDKASFEGNWFVHDQDSLLFYLDCFASFKDNIWVPLTTSVNKAYISFSASDAVRNLLFENERFGGENGSCPIVIVGDVNTGNTNNGYKEQGISFKNCYMASTSTYNPLGLANGVRAQVILRPTLGPNNSIDFISFEGCTFTPDISGGVVQTYNESNISSLLQPTFVIDFDYASGISATKGVNIPSSSDLIKYVNTPLLTKYVDGISRNGKIVPVQTATVGQYKVTLNLSLTYPTTMLNPIAFLVTTIGQGDSSYPSYGYSYTTTSIVTVSGVYTTDNHLQTAYTKLHGSIGGNSQASNADITGVFFGNGDTGSPTLTINSSTTNPIQLTITFGTRIQQAKAIYVKPLFDFSMLT